MFLEVSAKTAFNVEEAFATSAKQILQNVDTSSNNNNNNNNVRFIIKN